MARKKIDSFSESGNSCVEKWNSVFPGKWKLLVQVFLNLNFVGLGSKIFFSLLYMSCKLKSVPSGKESLVCYSLLF